MKTVIGYRIAELDLFIPLWEWQSFDGLYYTRKGYEFTPVWSE